MCSPGLHRQYIDVEGFPYHRVNGSNRINIGPMLPFVQRSVIGVSPVFIPRQQKPAMFPVQREKKCFRAQTNAN